jgi:superoxide dismutase, Cu-Zn family
LFLATLIIWAGGVNNMFEKKSHSFAVVAVYVAATLLTGCAHNRPGNMTVAKAALIDTQGASAGSATITESDPALLLKVRVSGLKQGTYAMHLHQVGKCDVPGFTTAGPHWNPAGKQHGLANSQGPHAGDLPNFNAASDGTANITVDLADMALSSGAQPLLDADGAALLIHAQPDDNVTDPSGNSGARIICGVFSLVR